MRGGKPSKILEIDSRFLKMSKKKILSVNLLYDFEKCGDHNSETGIGLFPKTNGRINWKLNKRFTIEEKTNFKKL